MLFALDRHAATPAMLAASAAGVVVIDRWVWSNAAYLDAQLGVESARWIVDLEINKLGLPIPDVTVLVAGAVDNARARVRRRASRSERIVDVLEEAVTIQEGAARAYEEYAVELGWTVLRNTGTVSEFHESIDACALNLLGAL
jgi:dTMP kinase